MIGGDVHSFSSLTYAVTDPNDSRELWSHQPRGKLAPPWTMLQNCTYSVLFVRSVLYRWDAWCLTWRPGFGAELQRMWRTPGPVLVQLVCIHAGVDQLSITLSRHVSPTSNTLTHLHALLNSRFSRTNAVIVFLSVILMCRLLKPGVLLEKAVNMGI